MKKSDPLSNPISPDLPFDLWKTTRVPKASCPYCGYKLDAVSGKGTPSSGDLSVCLNCASPLCFTDDLKLRVLTSKEIAELHPDNQIELRQFMFVARKRDRR